MFCVFSRPCTPLTPLGRGHSMIETESSCFNYKRPKNHSLQLFQLGVIFMESSDDSRTSTVVDGHRKSEYIIIPLLILCFASSERHVARRLNALMLIATPRRLPIHRSRSRPRSDAMLGAEWEMGCDSKCNRAIERGERNSGVFSVILAPSTRTPVALQLPSCYFDGSGVRVLACSLLSFSPPARSVPLQGKEENSRRRRSGYYAFTFPRL